MKRPYALLALITTLVHGLLLVNDGLYSEDMYWYRAMLTGRIESLSLLADRGLPVDPWVFWMLGRAPAPLFAARLLVFGSALAMALLLYRIGTRSGVISPAAAFFVAALAVAFPGFRTWPLFSITAYILFFAVYVAGMACAVEAETREGWARAAFRLAAVAFFLLGFNLNSLLVFHFGVVGLLAYWRRGRRPFVPVAVYLVLPFIYRAVQRVFFPPRGVFASHNALVFSPESILAASWGFLSHLWRDGESIIAFAIGHPLVAVGGLLLGAWFARRLTLQPDDEGAWRVLASSGAVLLTLGIAPYVLVGKWPINDTTATRHEILLGLPFAMLVTAAAIRLVPRDRWRWMFLCAVFAVCSALSATNHVTWLGSWVRQRAVIEVLSSKPELAMRKELVVYDRFVDRPGASFWSWYGIVLAATDGRSGSSVPRITNDPLLADLRVTETPVAFVERRDSSLVVRYLGLRLVRPASLPQFLRSLVTIVESGRGETARQHPG